MYYLNPVATNEFIEAGNNKRNAIDSAKRKALDKKRSIIIYRTVGNDLIFTGIAEFPYYLRNCKLDIRDIYWNE